ncbi:hypothetical protein B0H19DRAFT_1293235 [Mycena capillaripes]|nr:hypothetical protein B0H19DRAFT_1293235 [Mycena capillaripes]
MTEHFLIISPAPDSTCWAGSGSDSGARVVWDFLRKLNKTSSSRIEKCICLTPHRFGIRRRRSGATKFINCQDLSKNRHLDDDEGWKLPTDRFLPRDFSRIQRLSRASSPLRNWDDWHTWRRIPKSSPASLLMHYPMSIYWMLTETLNVASLGSKEPHAHLTVHYIGAELELNFIPIFSELALLLPHHDVDIVFFGPPVFHLGREGLKVEHRSSLIARAVHDSSVPIFTYDTPEVCGSGSVRIFLHTATKYWTISDHPTCCRKPDTILACNAGLFT